MKQLALILSLALGSSIFASCNKVPETQQDIQKQKQQQDEDKKAVRGDFKKSEGKSY